MAEPVPNAGGAKCVLVVEDEPELAKAVHHVLTFSGYDVLLAGDGQEAIVILGEMNALPAVILLDLAMPIMDGWQTLTAIRGDPRFADIPVVVVSAHTDERLVQSEQLVSLAKPYRMRDLVEAVRTFAPI